MEKEEMLLQFREQVYELNACIERIRIQFMEKNIDMPIVRIQNEIKKVMNGEEFDRTIITTEDQSIIYNYQILLNTLAENNVNFEEFNNLDLSESYKKNTPIEYISSKETPADEVYEYIVARIKTICLNEEQIAPVYIAYFIDCYHNRQIELEQQKVNKMNVA